MSVLQILYRKVNIQKELTEAERNEYIKKDIIMYNKRKWESFWFIFHQSQYITNGLCLFLDTLQNTKSIRKYIYVCQGNPKL